MPDREEVIERLRKVSHYFKSLRAYGWQGDADIYREHQESVNMAIALLKENEKPDCEHAEHDGIGCLGYARCTQDDEPIDVCKTCREYTGNRYEEVK